MRKFSHLTTPFHRLQWKLTLSYTLVTTGALLVVELLFFGAVLAFISSDVVAEIMGQSLQTEIVPQVRPYLDQTPPDIDGLREWSEHLVTTRTQSTLGQESQTITSLNLGNLNLSEANERLTVLDPTLTVLAQVPGSDPPLGEPFDVTAQSKTEQALTMAQRGLMASQKEADGVNVLAVPVMADNGRLLGVVVLTFQLPLLSREVIMPILQTLGLTLIPVTIATALIGTLFGFLTARGLTKRIHTMATAADAWSQGDFAVVSRDDSGDELGQLSRRLNRMAEQLQNLVEARQELATVEERNRLARDLHDSVKQQVFAIAMQLAAARALIDSDPAAATNHLTEAEMLTKQSQQELIGLIQELRPAALADRGLVEALKVYIADWSRRTQIEAEVSVKGQRPLLLITEQTLFRVAQEALANVARHSHARRVDLHLAFDATSVILTISDNGRGFHPTTDNFGMGLDSMRERITNLGGTFEIDSKPDAGTVVTAVIRKEDS
ncbi:MAG TPA: sensor histidine kinase [Anaerolineae bacterium]|nr:sensor histidine kinase [Anaerolineae bacterium]